jgi:3-mercaptopyruvate sulfurtransferase SseA
VLVDGDWLKEHLTEPAVVAIEVDEDSDAYYTSHLPGAIALDWRARLIAASVGAAVSTRPPGVRTASYPRTA